MRIFGRFVKFISHFFGVFLAARLLSTDLFVVNTAVHRLQFDQRSRSQSRRLVLIYRSIPASLAVSFLLNFFSVAHFLGPNRYRIENVSGEVEDSSELQFESQLAQLLGMRSETSSTSISIESVLASAAAAASRPQTAPLPASLLPFSTWSGQPLQEQQYEFTILGSLHRALGFEAKKLFVAISWIDCDGWRCISDDLLRVPNDVEDPFVDDEDQIWTHTSTGVEYRPTSSTTSEPVSMLAHHFSFPIERAYVCHSQRATSTPACVFRVFSSDRWRQHRLEGVGFWRMPCHPPNHPLDPVALSTCCGSFTQTLPCFRFTSSLRQELFRFFVGGSLDRSSLSIDRPQTCQHPILHFVCNVDSLPRSHSPQR